MTDTTPDSADPRRVVDDTADGLTGRGGEELIAVQDGPLAGQWFTWTNWQARLRAAHYIAERTGHRSPVLDYAPAGYQVANPVLAHTRGWAAIHRPTTAAGHVEQSAEQQGDGDEAETSPSSSGIVVPLSHTNADLDSGDHEAADDADDAYGLTG